MDVFSVKPIGYLRSPFLFKNGTPRQPTVCSQACGTLTIDKSVFNNPEHSLEGLEEYSHIWLFFIFHKNNNEHTKAKVRPPRLNGKKTGVFSTRSPYRPNNIGLTLAKIENISGATLTVSGIDILDGTPIVDLKPYIPHYDCPKSSSDDVPFDVHTRANNSANGLTDMGTDEEDNVMIETVGDDENSLNQMTPEMKQDTLNISTTVTVDCKEGHVVGDAKTEEVAVSQPRELECERKERKQTSKVEAVHVKSSKTNIDECADSASKETTPAVLTCDQSKLDFSSMVSLTKQSNISTANWLEQTPISQLKVRITPTAQEQLQLFTFASDHIECISDRYRLQFLKSTQEARDAIVNILHEDPRSTYRRKHCQDSLYYFTIDVIHVTCWFDEDIVEIVRLTPIADVKKLTVKIDQMI